MIGSNPATSVTAPTINAAMIPPAATDFNKASTVGVKLVAIANSGATNDAATEAAITTFEVTTSVF